MQLAIQTTQTQSTFQMKDLLRLTDPEFRALLQKMQLSRRNTLSAFIDSGLTRIADNNSPAANIVRPRLEAFQAILQAGNAS